MARVPDAPTVVGGQLDPYVQQSLLQGKQQASNRLLTAIQEGGATQRTGMQTASAEKQQQVAGEQEAQRTAAEQAMLDKKLAAEERGRREDRTHNELLAKMNNDSAAAIQTSLLDYYKARDTNSETERKDALERAITDRDLDRQLSAANLKSVIHGILGTVTLGQQKEAMTERLTTSLQEMAMEAEEAKSITAQTIDDVKRGINLDKRMELPVTGEPDIDLSKTKWSEAIYRSSRDLSGDITELPLPGMSEAQITPSRKQVVNPIGIIQDQLRAQGSKIDIGSLWGDNSTALLDGIANKEISAEDVRIALGVFEGSKVAFMEKSAKASVKEKGFWEAKVDDIEAATLKLSVLSRNTRKIVGSEHETVGRVIKSGMGESVGNALLLYRTAGQDMATLVKTALDDLRKSVTVPTIIEHVPGESDYRRKQIDSMNAAALRAFPPQTQDNFVQKD